MVLYTVHYILYILCRLYNIVYVDLNPILALGEGDFGRQKFVVLRQETHLGNLDLNRLYDWQVHLQELRQPSRHFPIFLCYF